MPLLRGRQPFQQSVWLLPEADYEPVFPCSPYIPDGDQLGCFVSPGRSGGNESFNVSSAVWMAAGTGIYSIPFSGKLSGIRSGLFWRAGGTGSDDSG